MNIIPFKSRRVDSNKPVRVYRNLHGGDAKKYSIKQGNLVVGHANDLSLYVCKLIVNEAGQKRVLAQRRKNVHAFIDGYIYNGVLPDQSEPHVFNITYNPYLNNSFIAVFPNGQITINWASYVWTKNGRLFGQNSFADWLDNKKLLPHNLP